MDESAMNEARLVLKDKYPSMLDYYIEDVTNYIEDISIAINSGIPEGVARPAHTIKSSSKRMGAVKLSEIAMEMEVLAQDARTSSAILKQRLEDMILIFEDSREALLNASPEKSA
jgi:HPt (histidine-containing phosphotransfer) domain-containing protein